MTSQGAIAFLYDHRTRQTSPELAVLMAITGVAFALHYPAAMGLVPLVVEGEKLQSANALLSLARSGALALGAASAGVFVATVGAGWAMAIDSATFGVAALLVTSSAPASAAALRTIEHAPRSAPRLAGVHVASLAVDRRAPVHRAVRRLAGELRRRGAHRRQAAARGSRRTGAGSPGRTAWGCCAAASPPCGCAWSAPFSSVRC